MFNEKLKLMVLSMFVLVWGDTGRPNPLILSQGRVESGGTSGGSGKIGGIIILNSYTLV